MTAVPATARKQKCATFGCRVWVTGLPPVCCNHRSGRYQRSGTASNPWAGQQACPRCGSTDWTLPYEPGEALWHCVEGVPGGCGLWFHLEGPA